MISITCTNCQSVLTIDDAFAGGVCRCQFCGTIQTVPSQKRSTAHLTGATKAKTLYHKEGAVAAPVESPDSMPPAEEMAESSGLAQAIAPEGRAEQTDGTAAPAGQGIPTARPREKVRVPAVAITAAAVVLVGIVATIIASRILGARQSASKTVSAPTASGPNFCGIPTSAGSVIFILDRGNSMADQFDALKAACYKALRQLGPDRKFQVILWDTESGGVEFPPGQMRNATAGAIEDCQRDFQDISAGGSSHLSGPLREAIERHPQIIIIATAKPELDEDDSTALRNATSAGVRINFLQIGSPSHTPAVEEATRATGGQIKTLTSQELRDSAT